MPPAGWYPDPANPAQRRYWNGAAWTDQVQAVPAAPASVPTFQAPTAAEQVVQPKAESQPAYKPAFRGKKTKSRRGLLWKIPVGLVVAFIALGVLASFTPEDQVDSKPTETVSEIEVPWDSYTSSLKPEIDSLAAAKDCAALQEMFDNADANDAATRNRTGKHGNADLMGYIDAKLNGAGCYEASTEEADKSSSGWTGIGLDGKNVTIYPGENNAFTGAVPTPIYVIDQAAENLGCIGIENEFSLWASLYEDESKGSEAGSRYSAYAAYAFLMGQAFGCEFAK